MQIEHIKLHIVIHAFEDIHSFFVVELLRWDILQGLIRRPFDITEDNSNWVQTDNKPVHKDIQKNIIALAIDIQPINPLHSNRRQVNLQKPSVDI